MKNINQPSKKIDLSSLTKKWPSSMVARSKISDFTGGILLPSTLANLDCSGNGPPSVRIGRKIAYNCEDFVKWLEDRVEKGGD